MRVLALGDFHLPWILWDALAEARDFAKFYKPDLIVQMGDFGDQYAWSRWPKDPTAPNPQMEWDMFEASVHKVHHMFGGKIPWIILDGNHCRRVMMRATEAMLPKQLVKSIDELFPYDNWKWHVGPRPLVIDGVNYVHGDEIEGAGNAIAKARLCSRSTIQGHDHKGYLEFIDTFDHHIWGMGVGCFIDSASLAAKYARRNLGRCWVGWGTSTNGEPHLYRSRLKRGTDE